MCVDVSPYVVVVSGEVGNADERDFIFFKYNTSVGCRNVRHATLRQCHLALVKQVRVYVCVEVCVCVRTHWIAVEGYLYQRVCALIWLRCSSKLD